MALFPSDAPSTPLTLPVVYPKPPSLHWGLVLLFSILTLGIVGVVWNFRQAIWVRRIDPASKAGFILAVGLGLELLAAFGAGDSARDGSMLVVRVMSAAAYVWATFSMRESIQDQFAVDLGGVMTFFFNVLYLQFHMTRIARGEYPVRYEPPLTSEDT